MGKISAAAAAAQKFVAALVSRDRDPLVNAYHASTNARLDDIERRLIDIERLLKVLSLDTNPRKQG